MTKLLDLPAALEMAGLTVRTLDGWEKPHIQGGSPYYWREPDGNPAGFMWHHTASSQYTPNREKANLWLGIGYEHTDRLYTEDYGDGFPVVVVANAYPAPTSSGYGRRFVLEEYVKQEIPFNGRPGSPDDNWAGNTHYINLENVLNGVGAEMEDSVWEYCVAIGDVVNELMGGWTPARHIAHGHHTNRKIDMFDGRFEDFDETVTELRNRMGDITMWNAWVKGVVEGWAEDKAKSEKEFGRLYDLGILEGASKEQTVAYWVGLLDDPGNAEWLGFVSRNWLSQWGVGS